MGPHAPGAGNGSARCRRRAAGGKARGAAGRSRSAAARPVPGVAPVPDPGPRREADLAAIGRAYPRPVPRPAVRRWRGVRPLPAGRPRARRRVRGRGLIRPIAPAQRMGRHRVEQLVADQAAGKMLGQFVQPFDAVGEAAAPARPASPAGARAVRRRVRGCGSARAGSPGPPRAVSRSAASRPLPAPASITCGLEAAMTCATCRASAAANSGVSSGAVRKSPPAWSPNLCEPPE
jgi:hypothetical protein